MNPTIPTLTKAPPTADQGAAPAAAEDGYEAVTGLDKETVALKRTYEAEVEAKVAARAFDRTGLPHALRDVFLSARKIL